MWGADPEDVIAVGGYRYQIGPKAGEMAALHLAGDGSWVPRDPGLRGELTAVWGTSGSNVFATASDGRILHYGGTSWMVMARPQALPLNGIAGRSPTDVYAVGDRGSIIHFDGVSWSPMVSGTVQDLHGVWADGERGVFAVGKGGTILHLAKRLPAPDGGDCAQPVRLYCGAPARYFGDTGGGSVVYRLDSPLRGRIDVQVIGHVAEVEASVVGARADGTCAPETQLGTEVDVVRDQRVYVLVDGPPSGYTFTLECTPGRVTQADTLNDADRRR